MTMQYYFDECRHILLECLIEALKSNREAIREITKNEDETGRIDAVSYDIFPWHRFACVSFRNEKDIAFDTEANYYQKRQIQYWPPDWKHYGFIGDANLEPVRNYTGDLWENADKSDEGQEAQHVIQLAAAHALLDQRVANLLERFGLYAEPRRDRIPWGGFEYVVRDGDQAFKANYCEFVLSDRVARRLLGRVPE
ncbi:MAG TPA: hypothetical protein VGN57_16790 [Pirellulaceae bacterium]|jgi:hypothetical protein|nr:hypothetical protein [Pirellulaceae bacterium]